MTAEIHTLRPRRPLSQLLDGAIREAEQLTEDYAVNGPRGNVRKCSDIVGELAVLKIRLARMEGV